jgi:hypothetical protein
MNADFTNSVEYVTDQIAAWTVALLAKANIRDPAFFLCIAYDFEGEGFPAPMPGVGLDAERRRSRSADAVAQAVARYGEGRRSGYYNPANYSHFDTGSLIGQSADIVRLGNSMLDTAQWRESRRTIPEFYVGVARALQKAGLDSVLSVTDDFVVFATDVHMEYWRNSMRQCVNVAQRQRLYNDGWLPGELAKD